MRPKPPNAERAIMGSSESRAMRMARSMMVELMRFAIGSTML